MTKYQDQIDMVYDMIVEAGQTDVVLWRKLPLASSTTPIDPAQPWLGNQPGTPREYPVAIVFLPTKGTLAQLVQSMKGSDIPTGNLTALLAGNVPFTVEKTDVVVRDGVTLSIKDFETLAPDGTPILYTIELLG